MTRLRIVSYNIHRGRGMDRVRDVARIADVLRHHEPDIAAVQEIVANRAWDAEGSQLRVLAERTGLPHATTALNCIRREGVYGNATLSRFPIDVAENFDVSLPLQIARGVLYTRHRLPHGVLHVLNAHLGFAGIEQRLQLRHAFKLLEDYASPDEPVVALGDMNDWRHRIAGSVAIPAGWRCAIGDAADAGPPTFPSREPIGALDKVFVRGPVVVLRAHVSRLALAKVASDHLPVIADLEIRG